MCLRRLIKTALFLSLYLFRGQTGAITLYGSVSNVYGQIGIRYDAIWSKVLEVCIDSPAAKAGVLPSDKVLLVNGEPYGRGNTIDGDAGQTVVLTVRRLNRVLTFSMIRVPLTEIKAGQYLKLS